MSAQWKMTGVSLVIILVIVIVAYLWQKAESFEHRLKMLTFPGWFQPWGHFSLPIEGQAILKLLSAHIPRSTTLPRPHPGPSTVPASAWVTDIQKCSLCYCEGTRPLLEQWQGEWGPWGSISLSLLLQAVQLWLQLACAIHLYTVSVVP